MVLLGQVGVVLYSGGAAGPSTYSMNTRGNREVKKCPRIEVGISECGYWLSKKIPSPNFDIEQSGNIRKAESAKLMPIEEVFVTELEIRC